MSYENLPPKLLPLVERAMADVKAKNPAWFAICEKISWRVNPNLRRSLGVAHYTSWTIEMSGPYVETADESVVYNTVTHELAHFISCFCYRSSGHTSMWKTVHTSLGGTAQRCTNAAEAGYQAVRNVVKRVIVGRDGKEYRCTVKRWENQQYSLERLGYRYLRTVRVNSDNSETIIHSHKEVKAAEIYLDARLNVIGRMENGILTTG
jgi:predicted SprT family Zn-dependent metalloprotease